MPNWCRNILKISGPQNEIARFRKDAVGFTPWSVPQPEQEPEPLNFHSLVPVPSEVLEAGYHEAGYHWQIQHWGCKWSAHTVKIEDKQPDYLFYWFETPWSPPLALFEQVSKHRPNLKFELSYFDEIYNFSGTATAQNGTLEVQPDANSVCVSEE
jgi:hypothetical protein